MTTRDRAAALRMLRGLRRLSQKKLGRRTGVHHVTISQYEREQRRLDSHRLERLLDALEVTPRAWDDTARHVEWLNWLAGEGPGEPGNRRDEIQRIAETAGRNLERHLGDFLGVLAGPSQ